MKRHIVLVILLAIMLCALAIVPAQAAPSVYGPFTFRGDVRHYGPPPSSHPEPFVRLCVYSTFMGGTLIWCGATNEQGTFYATPSTNLPYTLYATMQRDSGQVLHAIPWTRSNNVYLPANGTLKCTGAGVDGMGWSLSCRDEW